MMDIILVLAAQNDRQGNLNATAMARLDGGLHVWGKRRDAKFVVTGTFGPNFNQTNKPHAYYMASYLQAKGVGAADILPFVVSSNTVEDIFGAKQLLAHYAVASICLVTSESHLPRAQFIMEHAFPAMSLTFVGTPDSVSPVRLVELEAHEVKAMEILRGQGGVVYNGRLIKRSI